MNVCENYGENVFGDKVMQQLLPEDIYRQLQRTVKLGKHLDPSIADSVASAMRDWAIGKGATHFTHWFQPMTGITAEKHDAFVSPRDGGVIAEFSGKELIKGESDASSFPSGGLRATFEARGYTAWDATSYAFIKDGVLCIPTAFCSYGGHALDKKTPLLRSMEAINRQTMRIIRLFGNENVSRVNVTVGAEQEYFLIDESVFELRPDLVSTGRTLFGAKPPKGQELNDHYYGSIKPRVQTFMNELDSELWKLGIPAKTEHNEAAPAQHELAVMYETVNITADHNQIVMELLQKLARKHGMVCLLHEKPFAGVNGSGKHNNWSVSTDTGVNLLNPGDTPAENAQFLLFLTAVIKAVDEYQELLRISVATAGNDCRLGGFEAPPAVISIFLGEELTGVLGAILSGEKYGAKEKQMLRVGVHTLPPFPKDSTDRNRTSPFAFTGNKFEFRMPGSADSISEVNVVLNTAVAEALSEFADELENAADFDSALHELIKRNVREHRRIIFNGNGYDEKWLAEAESRGLSNLADTPAALSRLVTEKNVALFTSHRVYSEEELAARCEILKANYSKLVKIEAATMLEMLSRDIFPAVSAYTASLADNLSAKESYVTSAYEKETLCEIQELFNSAFAKKSDLASVFAECENAKNDAALFTLCGEKLVPAMKSIRADVDKIETLVSSEFWPYPSYAAILTSVK